jgi:hypothetical protein
MKLPSITAALAAALFLAGAPLLASAAGVTPVPVQIDDRPIGHDDGSRSKSDSSATDKAFVLENQDSRLIDRAEHFGCYGKGVTVRHDFTDIESRDNQDRSVEKLPYDGGSVWETDAGC